jgi:3-oxoacyl-[acyl-carrier protein] reductase
MAQQGPGHGGGEEVAEADRSRQEQPGEVGRAAATGEHGPAAPGVPALLAGRTALVTGGTRGIGRGIAETLCAAGARVVITGRDAGRGGKAAAEISARGSPCEFAAADVRRLPDLEAAAAYAHERFGSLDVLVHNAGVYPEVPLEQMAESDWDLVHDTNLKGTFFAFRACLPFLKRSPAGRIVLVSSITGPVTGYPGLAHYGASKAGMDGFMRTAAIEVAPFRITVNAVAPGSIRTEGLADLGAQAIEAMQALIPLKRLGEPGDVAGAVLYLASDLASFVTGQSLVVDGGQTLPEIPA